MPKAMPPTRSSTKGNRQRPSPPGQRNEGEGNKTAARRYDRAVAKTVRSGVVARKAREAARALSGPEGSELRRAEALAKRGKTASDRPTASK
jgi:hypothetical protein